MNDIADAQAKIGRLKPTPTKIVHQHLPTQTVTLMWNNNVPIYRDVKKYIGTISNYKRLEEHFNHPSLQDIKEVTASQLNKLDLYQQMV